MKYKIYSACASENPHNLVSLKNGKLNYEHILNNKKGLSELYNSVLINERLSNENDWVIFLHDDTVVNFNEDHLIKILSENNDYDLLGVAGSTEAKISSPCLWHLMNETPKVFPNPKIHSGCVYHDFDGNFVKSEFGPYPRRVILIDGVLMAIKINREDTLWFDTSLAKFHFYDLDFSLNAFINKRKTRVVNLPIIHLSPGLRSFTEEWKEGNDRFIQKWSNLL